MHTGQKHKARAQNQLFQQSRLSLRSLLNNFSEQVVRHYDFTFTNMKSSFETTISEMSAKLRTLQQYVEEQKMMFQYMKKRQILRESIPLREEKPENSIPINHRIQNRNGISCTQRTNVGIEHRVPNKDLNVQKQLPRESKQPHQKMNVSTKANILKQLRIMSITPNVTQLKYVQYDLSRINDIKNIVFDQKQIKRLKSEDLSVVESLKLDDLKINDSLFVAITQLNLRNLKSLGMENNNIGNITPLENLNMKQFVDLDFSWNNLGRNSALFLANRKFPELVYLTISFATGKNQAAWGVLLSKKLQNYPKLQAIDIYDCDQLSKQMKERIKDCIKDKSEQLQLLKIDRRFKNRQPQLKQIKITWFQSKQQWEQKSQKQLKKENNKWIARMKAKNQDYLKKKDTPAEKKTTKVKKIAKTKRKTKKKVGSLKAKSRIARGNNHSTRIRRPKTSQSKQPQQINTLKNENHSSLNRDTSKIDPQNQQRGTKMSLNRNTLNIQIEEPNDPNGRMGVQIQARNVQERPTRNIQASQTRNVQVKKLISPTLQNGDIVLHNNPQDQNSFKVQSGAQNVAMALEFYGTKLNPLDVENIP